MFPKPVKHVKIVAQIALVTMVMAGLYLYDQYRLEQFKLQLRKLKAEKKNEDNTVSSNSVFERFGEPPDGE